MRDVCQSPLGIDALASGLDRITLPYLTRLRGRMTVAIVKGEGETKGAGHLSASSLVKCAMGERLGGWGWQ
jgi:hypothetical protein